MRWVAILLAATLVLTETVAQEKPNFSGKWVLVTRKSDFNSAADSQAAADRQVVIVIDHKEPKVKVTRTIKGPGGESTNDWQYTTDGKESTNTIGGHQGKSVTKWDDNKLVTITKVETPDGAVETKESWELADAGKQMVVTRNYTGPHGKNNTRTVFTNQK